jgi:small GTP-binding protein
MFFTIIKMKPQSK